MSEALLETKGICPTAHTLVGGSVQQTPSDSFSNQTGADVLDVTAALNKKVSETRYPLWSFSIEGTPLSAKVYLEDGYWFAENENLNIYAHGDSPSTAIEDLKKQVLYFMEFYVSQNDVNLAPYALHLKQRFAKIERDR